MQKRGQVTTYIILGIVILIVFGFLISIRFDLLKSEFEKQLELNSVPSQLMPVKGYMDTCITDIITDSVFTISSRGGYLKIPDDILPRSINNPFSNSLELYPGSEVAYWFYQSANGIHNEQVPTLESIQLQIEEYISSEFNSCYQDLGFYENEGFEIRLPEEVFPTVNIESKHIEIMIDAPTYIGLNEVSKEIEKYVLSVELPLGEFYEKSKEIFLEELDVGFLEDITLDVVAVYEDIPYNGIDLECGRKTWIKSEIENKIKEYLFNNIAALRLKGVEYLENDDFYDYFSVNVDAPEGVNSNFMYSSNWPFAMEVTPSQGDFLLSDSLTQNNPDINKMLNLFFCINHYNFVYDIKYPVLISLIDDSGYVFQFSTMVIIDNNQKKKSEYEFVDYSETTSMKNNICGYPSAEVSIETYDSDTMDPLQNVEISYQCSLVNCYLGKTNSFGRFDGEAPACLNGNVIAQKEGYHPGDSLLSTNEEQIATVMLNPYTELEVQIKVLDLETGQISYLQEGQHVSFQLIGIDGGHISIINEETEKIKLVPGYYAVTSYIYGDPDFEISSEGYIETQCVEVPRSGILGLFLNEEKCFDIEIEDMDIDNVIIGGSEFEWTAPSSLTNYDKIVFYATTNGIPGDISGITDIFNKIKLNNLNDNFRGIELI